MANILDALTADYGLSLGFNDDVGIFTSPNDPTIGLGEAAPVGSLLLRSTGALYIKIGPLDTDWFLVDTTAVINQDLASIQARRTTTFSIPTIFTDIPFDTTDIQNLPAVIEHDPINPDRFLIKETGLYKLSYNATANVNGTNQQFVFQVTQNDVAVVNGSVRTFTIAVSDAVGGDIVFAANANDFITLQIKCTTTPTELLANTAVLNIVKLHGTKGIKGDAGTGSSIAIEHTNIPVPGGPHQTLNFEGGLTVTDDGGGQATINVTSSGTPPTIQVRNTATFAIATSYTDVVFDTLDVLSVPSAISQNANNTQIDIHESGYYSIEYNMVCTKGTLVTTRIMRNSAIIVNGGVSQTKPSSSAIDEQGIYQKMVVQLTAGDFVTLQSIASSANGSTTTDTTMVITKLQGIQGIQGSVGSVGPVGPAGPLGPAGPVGPPGAGASVNISDEGVTLGAFTDVNFVGSAITATDAGAGTANVTITSQTLIYGTEYQYIESPSVVVTNSTAYVKKVTMTTPNLPAGTYRVGWKYSWNYNNTTRDFKGRILVDNTTQYDVLRIEPKDSAGSFGATGTNQKHIASGFFNTTFSGIHTIDIEFATQTSANSASMWDARLEFWRVQ